MLVQFAFFSSYFVFSYPAGWQGDRLGYKKTMVAGLFILAAEAAGFLPAARLASFPTFLMAFIVLAAGMTTVQVAGQSLCHYRRGGSQRSARRLRFLHL